MEIIDLKVTTGRLPGEPQNWGLDTFPSADTIIQQSDKKLLLHLAGEVANSGMPITLDTIQRSISSLEQFKIFTQNPAMTMSAVALAIIPGLINDLANNTDSAQVSVSTSGPWVNYRGRVGNNLIHSTKLHISHEGVSHFPDYIKSSTGETIDYPDGIQMITANNYLDMVGAVMQRLLHPVMNLDTIRGSRLAWSKLILGRLPFPSENRKFEFYAADRLGAVVKATGLIQSAGN